MTGGQCEVEGAAEMEHYDLTTNPIPLCHRQAGRSVRNEELDPDKRSRGEVFVILSFLLEYYSIFNWL